jgi:hypothetical protein
VDEAIAIALEIFRNSADLDDESVFQAVVDKGVERSLASRIVEFLPIAYCRVLFINSGVQFSNSFTRGMSPLKIQSLSLVPEWVFFLAYAEREIRRGATKQELLMVAGRSAEFQAVNRMLNKKAELKNIVLSPIVLPWPEDGPEEDTGR